MAKYNRNILVPYLRDVCTAELLCSKLARDIEQCKKDIAYYSNEIKKEPVSVKKPLLDEFEQDHWDEKYFFCLMCGFFLGGVLIIIFGGFSLLMFLLAGVCGLCMLSSSSDANEKRDRLYNEAMERYEEKVKYNKNLTQQRPKQQLALSTRHQRLPVLQKNLASAQGVRSELYGINIIPAKYRNKYAAYYLFDYFSTSREDDLDKIIQTLLLDEIKQRLDKVIYQNEQIIINQRIHLAMQEQSNQMLAEQHREKMIHITRMEQNQELQLDYQNMIAKNQLVTNFLLAADYLYK